MTEKVEKVENEKANVASETTVVATVSNVESETKDNIIAFEKASGFDNEDLFVTEKTTFEAKVRYYKDEKNGFIVEGVSEEFDEKNKLQEIIVTCKYPSQSDYQSLLNSPSFKGLNDLRAVDVVLLELSRLSLLIRGWSLKQDLARIMEMDPRIVKGILWAVSQKIGMQGIF